MTFYGDMQTVAFKMLTEFGQSGLLRQSSSVYDPSTGEAVQTDVDTVVTVAVLPLPRGKDEFAPELIEMSTNKVLMSANELVAVSIVPGPNDKVVVDSVVYDITDLTPINPAGTPVVYKMLVAN